MTSEWGLPCPQPSLLTQAACPPLGFLGTAIITLAASEFFRESHSSRNPVVWGLARGVFPKGLIECIKEGGSYAPCQAWLFPSELPVY